MLKKACLILILQLMFSGLASADSVLVDGGWEHTPNSNYGDGGVFQVRYEKSLVQNRFGEIDLGTEYGYHGSTSVFPENGPDYGDFDGHSVMGGVFYHLPFRFSPYIGASAGWSWWDFSESEDSKSKGISVDTSDSFCVKYSIGADWKLKSNWSLNIEWSYFETDIKKNAHYSDGSFSNILDTGETLGHAETNVVVGLRYSW